MHGANPDGQDLQRRLRARHIQLIALGGTIGVGLFLGSGSAMRVAGPLLIPAYAMAGLAVFFVLRALGEVAVAHPTAGAFGAHAHRYFGPLAGYMAGWTYWFILSVVCMAEATALGIYAQYWWPDLPQGAVALLASAAVTGINLAAVGIYGELEFWFAIVKIVAIVAMLLAGSGMVLFGLGNGGHPVGAANLLDWPGGPAGAGLSGFVAALPLAIFAFTGMESIAMTAGEAEDPARTLPRAISAAFWRIMVFYCGTLAVLMAAAPRAELIAGGSPFVRVAARLGLPHAGDVMNLVVMTAAFSSLNACMFGAGRMLFGLARQGAAPASVGGLSRARVPAMAVALTAAAQVVGIVLNFVLPKAVFGYLMDLVAAATMAIWLLILALQHAHRRQVGRSGYGMPGAPWTTLATAAFLLFILGGMAVTPATRPAIVSLAIWLALLAGSARLRGAKPVSGPG